MNKYELTDETKLINGKTLYKIRALREFETQFGIIKKGHLGGFVQSEENLSHKDGCWIDENACVFDTACIFDNAYVCGDAKVFGCTDVFNNARIGMDCRIVDGISLYELY